MYGIEGINESALNDHLMYESESSVGDGVYFVGEFESNGSGGKLRFSEGGLATVGSKGDGGLVGIKKIVYSFAHLKSFVCGLLKQLHFRLLSLKSKQDFRVL